jgi:hypothetical protein
MPDADADWFFKWAFSPPKDFTEWENLLKVFIQAQIQDGIQADYIIGDESDWMFYGTQEQYFEMYKLSVKAIKEIDQNIVVGALGVSDWTAKKDTNCPAEATGLNDGECPPGDLAMIEALINYVSAHNVPLDFIDWHFPNLESLKGDIERTRALLKNNNLPENLPITIGEWLLSPTDEDESTEKGAAYAIFMMKNFLDNGIYRHSATSIHDQYGWTSGNWQHVGYFSSEGIIKAKWNALKAFDKLSGNRVALTTSDEKHLAALATNNKGVISVLIANFISEEEAAIQAGLDSFSNESKYFIQVCIADINNGKQAFYNLYKKYLNGELSPSSTESIFITHCGSFPSHIRDDFINSKQIAIDVYTGDRAYLASVELNVTNIVPGVYNYRKYVVDGDTSEIHSNPCRYNKKTETVPSNTQCGINGAVDLAINSAVESSINASEDYLLSMGYYSEGVDALSQCGGDTYCVNSLVDLFCQYNPANCDKLKSDLAEAGRVKDNLFYYGTYTASNSETYTIPTSIKQINSLKEVSLEGSRQEKQITITDGIYTENLTLLPYSVVLIEILP